MEYLLQLPWGGTYPVSLVLGAGEAIDRCFVCADLSVEGDNSRSSLRSVRSVHRLDSEIERDRSMVKLETSLDGILKGSGPGMGSPGMSFRGGVGGIKANFSSHPSASISSS